MRFTNSLNNQDRFVQEMLDRHSQEKLASHLLESSNVEKYSLPDEYDSNNHCRVCNKKFAKRCKYRYHLQIYHSMTLETEAPTASKIIHRHVTPDWDDPQNFCSACEKLFTNQRNYRTHLQTIHQMKLGNTLPTFKSSFHHTRTAPYVVKPLYCTSCKKTFTSHFDYSQHMKFAHKVTFSNNQNKQSTINKPKPDQDDPDYYCNGCKKYYSSIKSFHHHLESNHGMLLRREENSSPPSSSSSSSSSPPSSSSSSSPPSSSPSPSPKTNNLIVVPDINSPGLHCNVCKKTFDGKHDYRRHLQTFHEMIITPTQENGQETMSSILNSYNIPDKNDTDFYCNSCECIFISKKVFHSHLQRVHKMAISMPPLGMTAKSL